MILTKPDVQKIAQEIVDETLSTGKPVKECVVIRIKGMDLNPEQIKRIVENVNVQSFLKRYDDATPDQKEEASVFDVVNPDDIITDDIKTSAHQSFSKTASFDDLWDYLGPPPGDVSTFVKEASVASTVDEVEPISAKQKNKTFGYLKRAVEELDQKIANVELDYLDQYTALRDTCSGIYFDQEKFLKHAGAALGVGGTAIASVLCKDLGSVEYNVYQDGEKLAFYDKSVPGVRQFESLVKLAERRHEYIKARQLLFNTRESLARKWGVI